MPRPCKRRRICALPAARRFRCLEGGEGEVRLGVDEFEALRLIDLEGLTQADCARRMEVSRATVQAIYVAARAKTARFLAEGGSLTIGGGSFALCPGGGDYAVCPGAAACPGRDCADRRCGGQRCGCGGCRNSGQNKEEHV